MDSIWKPIKANEFLMRRRNGMEVNSLELILAINVGNCESKFN